MLFRSKPSGSNRSCCQTLFPNCLVPPTNLRSPSFKPPCRCIGSNSAVQDRQNMFETMLMCASKSSPDWSTMRLQATGVLHSQWRAKFPGCLLARRPCWIFVRMRLGSYANAGLQVTSGTSCNRAPIDLRAVRPALVADELRPIAPPLLAQRTPPTQNAGRARTWR